MKSTILFKPCGVANYQCLQLDSAGNKSLLVGDAERLAEEAQQAELVYVAPADAIGLRTVGFDAHERKILRQTLPYSLEDELVEDVEQLHFALGGITGNKVAVAIVNRQTLQLWLDDLQGQGLEIQRLVSELQLMPMTDRGWTLLINADQWLLRCGDAEGFAMEPDAAGLAMQLLLDEAGELPETLQVYCSPEQQPAVLNQLPELLRAAVHWQVGQDQSWDNDSYWYLLGDGLLQQDTTGPDAINLLQGNYALSLPWQKWWNNWRLVASLLLLAIVVQLLSTFTRQQVLSSHNVELRAAIEQSYRTVIPKGAILDPERQLRRRVNALRGSNSEGVVSLIDRVGQELGKVNGLVLQSLNYTGKQQEIRLTLLANSFDDVETVRTRLEQLGLDAALTGSSADGDKTRARLRIRV